MTVNRIAPLILLCTALMLPILNGCAVVGPDYKAPTPEVPEEWNQPEDPALLPTREEIKDWWTVFNDPMLNRLIDEVGKRNLDLRIAVSRVNEARARLGVVAGQQVPVVGFQASSTAQEGPASMGMPTTATTRHSVGLDASWEIDLFGRIARSVESATADFQATEEDRIDVMITVYAEMARTYLAVRTYQARLAAADGNIKSQKEALKLTKQRFKFGLATDLDVAQAEQVLANSEAMVPPLRIELARAINTISVLLGKPPATLWDQLSVPKDIPIPPEKVTVGLPADLLRQRPDIRAAERRLAAQTARIGVATADLYPSLSLTGSIGLGGTGNLFNAGSSFFTFGPSLRWNLFDGGRVRQQIKVEDALTEQAVIIYEKTVLNALNEVENALTAYLEQRVQFEARERSVKASRRAKKLSMQLYKDGLVDYQRVLDAQRVLLDTENQMAEAKGNAAGNLVRLYKALGGGWDPDEIKPVPPPEPKKEKKS